MSKIRRIRYVDNFRVQDDNPFIPEGEVRYHWQDWIEVDVFEDARIRILDLHHRYPGKHVMLRVPMTDPETGEDTDVDGDEAVLRIRMVGAEIDFDSAKGFVSRQELAHEKAYRSQDIDACLASYDEASNYEYVREEWQIINDS